MYYVKMKFTEIWVEGIFQTRVFNYIIYDIVVNLHSLLLG